MVREIEEMGKSNLLGSKIFFSPKEVAYLKQGAIAYFSARHELEQVKNELQEYKACNNFYKDLDKEYYKLSDELSDLAYEHQLLEKDFKHMTKTIESNPELKAMFEKCSHHEFEKKKNRSE